MSQPKQPKQGRQSSKLKQLRYRKLTLAGGNTIVTYNNSVGKVRPKGMLVQFPLLDNNEQNAYNPPVDPKLYEEQLYRKNNYRAMKALMKAYDEGKKKNSCESMNMLGLDIKKINYVPQQSKAILNKKQPVKTKQTQFKSRNLSPNQRINISSRSNISRKKSQSSDHHSNREVQSTIEGSKLFKLQMADSGHLFSSHSQKYQNLYQSKADLNSQSCLKSYKNLSSEANTASQNTRKKVQSKDSKGIKSLSPSPRKQKKQYLYQKLIGKQLIGRQEVNLVYERRMRSYTDLLFKLQYAHNIYINLDLRNQQLNTKGRRVKYFVGPGNNSAMIRGLLKRRYWWVLSQDKNQCCFVWTQIKVPKIFQKQKRALRQNNISNHRKITHKKSQIQLQQSQTLKMRTDSFKKVKKSSALISQSKKKQNQLQLYNYKIFNENDYQSYQRFYNRHQKNSDKQHNYIFRYQKVLKQLKLIPTQDNIIHNHLQNNFYLGNKKALFYNMKQYYNLIGQNVFDYLPLTFHIKKGFKDSEYKRFIAYYNRRKNAIKKEEKEAEQQGQKKIKTRNIWIVKPGQNTNQGRGITVIDQIYQLNNIIKRIGEPASKAKKSQLNNNKQATCQSTCQQQQTKRTYIVQMYIDRPFLYNNRKFDIRHYMLITNLYGVTRAYWYLEGYIRTSSYQFRIDAFEPEIHLTNDYIQKKYPEYGKYEACNKISYDEFQRYLDSNYTNKKYNFKNNILPKMKKMATDAAKSVYTKISPKNHMHNFQIFGLDFMIDKNFKPWLIQINTNPCLQVSCPLLDRIVPYMVQQSFKLSLDIAYPPPSEYPNTCKHYAPMINLQAFKYELIFDSITQGAQIMNLYKKIKGNLIEQIGQIQDDQCFKDDGKQIKLDDFT